MADPSEVRYIFIDKIHILKQHRDDVLAAAPGTSRSEESKRGSRPINDIGILLDLRLYNNILVDYVVYHFLRYRAKKVALDHIDWFFLNRPVMGQMGPYETFSTWSQESQCWEIKFDDLGILLDSSAIDHLLDWDNHLITIMILEYGIDWDNHWQSPSHFLGPLAT